MTNQKNTAIQSLWIGEKFSNIERLSALSYIKNGHEYHLYCYQDIEGVPDGVSIIDANEIISESEIFCYKVQAGRGSYSAFSNMFRYKLIHEKGGYWSDTDVVCLKPFDFNEEYIFSSEISHINNNIIYGNTIASSFFYCDTKSEIMKTCYEICEFKDKEKIQWGEIGPKLLGDQVKKNNLINHVKPYHFFNPIPWNQIDLLFNNSVDMQSIMDNCFCVHLWNEIWRRSNIDKNSKFDKKCIFEKLKNLYL
jgi:hypothetical protein